MKSIHKFFFLLVHRFQHIIQRIVRITDADDKRVTDAGDTRITDDSA